jgi:hypothetical protein
MGAARDLLDGGEVEQVASDVFLTQLVRGLAVETGQLSDGVHVRLHGPFQVTAQLQVLDHTSAQRCHDFLLEEWVRKGEDRTPLRWLWSRSAGCTQFYRRRRIEFNNR